MTCSTYRKREAVLHMLYIAFLTALSITTAYSVVFGACHMDYAEDKIAFAFTVLFSMLIIAVDFFECRAMGARLCMNEEGIGISRFGRMKVFIKWNEIKEIGIGSIPTPFGKKERVYFCDRKLDEQEKNDLVTLKYHTVHFSYIPKGWYEKMNEFLPMPLTEEIKEKYVG